MMFNLGKNVSLFSVLHDKTKCLGVYINKRLFVFYYIFVSRLLAAKLTEQKRAI